MADALSCELHYTVDEKQKAVLITDDGYEAAEDVLEVGPVESRARRCLANAETQSDKNFTCFNISLTLDVGCFVYQR